MNGLPLSMLDGRVAVIPFEGFIIPNLAINNVHETSRPQFQPVSDD